MHWARGQLDKNRRAAIMNTINITNTNCACVEMNNESNVVMLWSFCSDVCWYGASGDLQSTCDRQGYLIRCIQYGDITSARSLIV